MAIRDQKGFTLSELFLVVSIAGLLATIIFISINDSRIKSTDARRLNDVNDIRKALELYAADHTVYPAGVNIVLGSSVGCLSSSGFTSVCPGGAKVYLANIPQNPGLGGIPYIYNQMNNGLDFRIDFKVETDIGAITAGNHVMSQQGIQ